MRRFSLSTWMTIAILAFVLPFVVFLLFLVAQLQASESESVDRRTLRSAQSIARTIEPVIDGMITTVSLVSSTEELAMGDLEEFHRRTSFALKGTGQFVILADAQGRQLLNTRVDYGTPLGVISDRESFASAISSPRPVVSDAFFGKTSGKWVFNVLKPLGNLGTSPARVSIATKNLDDLADAVSNLPLPSDWSAAVVDGRQNIFRSTGASMLPDADQSLFPREVDLVNLARKPFIQHLQGEEEMVFAYSPIRGTGWNVIVWGPLASAQESILQTWRFLFVGTGLLLTVMFLVLYAASTYFRSKIRGLAKMAEEMGEGHVVSPIDTRVSELDTIARALSSASFDRHEKEQQLRFVMRELAHRTKNLISVVLAIVRQSAKTAKTPRELLTVIADRVAGLGQSIDLLTATDRTAVSLRQLVESQLGKFGTLGVNIKVEGSEFHLSPDAVQNLGMAFHELATNAAKYGALSVKTGTVTVGWNVVAAESGDHLHIVWSETGGPTVNTPDQTGFGTQILSLHVSSVCNGTTETRYQPEGLVWELRAPVTALGLNDQAEQGPV